MINTFSLTRKDRLSKLIKPFLAIIALLFTFTLLFTLAPAAAQTTYPFRLQLPLYRQRRHLGLG